MTSSDEITRMAGLPEKWRKWANAMHHVRQANRVRECANELEAKLRALSRKTGENSGDCIKSSYPEIPDNSVDRYLVPEGRITYEMVERLARYIAQEESHRCKSLDEALHHQSKWMRIVPEARKMLEAALAQPADADAEGGK